MLSALVLAALVTGPTTLAVDPADVEAAFDLKATLHTVHGTTKRVSGTVEATPVEGPVLALSGRIEIDAASLETGNSKRDATMRAKSLQVATYPKMVLEPERFAPSGDPSADGTVEGTLTGRLTIRGVTRPATIALALTSRAGGLAASGRFDVSWADFGIPDPSFLFVTIEPVVHARFHARFVPRPPGGR